MPELFDLPKWFPLHPSRYYCHTRLMFLAMAALAGERFQGPVTPLVQSLREELFPTGFDRIDFAKAWSEIRKGDLVAAWTKPLDLAYRAMRAFDRRVKPARREASVEALRERIRFELATTHHTSLSPVSGILNVLALHAGDPNDADALKAFDAMEHWIWEDETDGTRVAGARSASWDTALATQALAEVAVHVDVTEPLARATKYLEAHQIRAAMPDALSHDRIDPRGGYCFASASHGWPVSDCTAEALLGRMRSTVSPPDAADIELGVRFLLKQQNKDGGFSTYEPQRVPFSIEWLNPAEMFGDSMTEPGYVECTASCIGAMARARSFLADPSIVELPLRRAVSFLWNKQHPNGSWPAGWGVRLIYGTLFGIRGLIAGGVPTTDPAIRKACAWLKSRQRADGSWGERPSTGPEDGYVEETEGQVVQTAWALSALLEAGDPEWDALERAARFLTMAQLGSGEWPRQAPTGVFFHVALLDYSLYRSYFPLWALAAYETRRKKRNALYDMRDAEPSAAE